MARALLRRTNLLAYPGGAPGFDPAHPAVAAAFGSKLPVLSTVAMGGNHVNLLTGVKGTIVGTPTSGIDAIVGPYQNFSISATDASTFAMSALNATQMQQLTAAAIFTPTATSGNQNLVIAGNAAGAGTGLAIAQNAIYFSIFCGGSSQIGSGLFTPIVGRPYFFAASNNNNNPTNFVVVDLLTGAISAAIATGVQPALSTAGTGTWVVGNRSSGQQAQAKIHCTMLHFGYMPMSVLLQWAQDPWAFWYPQKFDLLFALGQAATGGSFIPAWARNSNLPVLGTGTY